MPPETRYAKSGDLNIAYQVVGDGPFDLVYVPGWVSNVELHWEKPKPVRLLERLASYSEGSGMSVLFGGQRELKGVGSWRLYSVLDA